MSDHKPARAPLLGLHITGLKCDAPGCGWRDDAVTLDEYPEYLNARCPVCGSNVLTEADFRTVARLVRVTNWVNRWCGWMRLIPHRRGPPIAYVGDFDGTGKIGPLRKEKVCLDPSVSESTDGPESNDPTQKPQRHKSCEVK